MEKLSENLYTACDLLVRRGAEIKSERVRFASRITVKGCARNNANVVLQGGFYERSYINRLRECAPDKKSTLGSCKLNTFGKLAVKCIQHKRALMTVYVLNILDVPINITFGHIFVAKHLEKQIRVHVTCLL